MLGTHFLTNLHAHDRAAFLAGNLSTRDEAKPWTFRRSAKNGDWVWLESFGKPDLNAEGRNVGRTAYLRDVTDRERATASLHQNLRILDSVAHISGIGGWSLELVIRFFAPEAQPLITQAIAVGIEHSKPWKLELPLIIATGRQIWLRASGEVEREHGRATNLLGCIRCDRHVDSTSAGILRRHQ